MGPVQAIEMPGLEKFQPQLAMLPPPESAPPQLTYIPANNVNNYNNVSNPFANQSQLQPPGVGLMNPSPKASPRVSRVSHPPPANTSVKKARGLYDFAAQEQGELNFKAGEELVITEDIGGGWLRAKNQIGVEGLIPGNYVQTL